MSDLRLRYQTIEFGDIDIHLCTLRDNQQFDDPQGIAENLGISSATWPLFGIIWPSSLVLAHYLNDYDIGKKSVLEVGCGMALSSLLLNKRGFDITATDYHPAVEYFMQRNTELNQCKPILFERTDWKDTNETLGCFDIIIGSDVLYEDEHIALLADFINRHSNTHCEVILVDPSRGRKSKLSAKMITHGFSSTHHKPVHTNYLVNEYKGDILRFSR